MLIGPRFGQRLIAVGFIAAAILTVAVVVMVTATGQPLSASENSLNALAAWSIYATAVASLLLVVLVIAAGFEARREFRSAHRPVPSLGGALFVVDGIAITIENVGPGAAVSVEIDVWALPLGFTATPVDYSEGLLRLTEEVSQAVPPLFSSELTALGPSGARAEVLRFGPRASEYSPEWVGELGIVLWEVRFVDLFGQEYPGSGYLFALSG